MRELPLLLVQLLCFLLDLFRLDNLLLLAGALFVLSQGVQPFALLPRPELGIFALARSPLQFFAEFLQLLTLCLDFFVNFSPALLQSRLGLIDLCLGFVEFLGLSLELAEVGLLRLRTAVPLLVGEALVAALLVL